MIRRTVKISGVTAWLMFLLLFFIYLLNSDRVYQALSGTQYAVKLPAGFSLRASGSLMLNWGRRDFIINSRFEEGKCFTVKPNKITCEKAPPQIRFFFRSADALYEVMEFGHPFWSPAHGEAGFFASTKGLASGIYAAGMYLKDDEGERFVWIKSTFEKDERGPKEYVARPVAVTTSGVNKKVKFAVEQIENKDKKLMLQGWCVFEGADMEQYDAYVALRDARGKVKAFYAPLYTRLDIAGMYGDMRAANSGFEIGIAGDEFSRGPYAVRMVLKSRITGEAHESAGVISHFFESEAKHVTEAKR